jgi:hypothetical protein
VRRAGERYSTGNALLHIWLQFWATDAPESPMSDAAALDQADEEQQGIMALVTANKRRLRMLEEQQAVHGVDTPPAIKIEIEDITKQIAALNTRLAVLQAHE